MKKLTKLSLLVLALCGFSVINAQVPPTAPPVLGYDAEDVLSFISDEYNEAFNLDQTPNYWGSTSSWDYTGTGDDAASVVVLNDLDWIAISLNGNAGLKDYEYVHVDVFCNVDTEFRIGFHRHYPDNREQYFPMIEEGTMVPGKWYSIDYALDDFFMGTTPGASGTWEGHAAHYLRFGGNMEAEEVKHEYANEIYVTNFVLFNGTPKCLGGVVRGETSISNAKEDVALNVYVKNGMLNYSSSEEIKGLNIYDIAGKLIASFSVNNMVGSTNVGELSSGIYIVSANYANGQVANLRIVK